MFKDLNSLTSRIEILEYFKPSGFGIEIGVEKGNFSKTIFINSPYPHLLHPQDLHITHPSCLVRAHLS